MSGRKLAGRRILMVIAPDQFRDEELLTPKQLLQEAGAQVSVASPTKAEAKGMLGAKYTPELTLSDAKSADYDAVVVVGGMGSPEYLWNDALLHQIVGQSAQDGKVVAAICLSGAVLAKAGVLKGKEATVWPMDEALQSLKEGGASYLEQPVVQDGKFITANGPEAAKAFGESIVAELSQVKV